MAVDTRCIAKDTEEQERGMLCWGDTCSPGQHGSPGVMPVKAYGNSSDRHHSQHFTVQLAGQRALHPGEKLNPLFVTVKDGAQSLV